MRTPQRLAGRRSAAPYLLAGLSAVFVVIGNIRGLALGDDGVGYEAIADSLKAGKGLRYFLEPDGLTIWPPLWPTLMGGVSRITHLSTPQAAIALNAAVAVMVVLATNQLLRRLVAAPRIQLIGTAVVAIGGSSVLFGHLLMTDFAFVAVMLWMFVRLIDHRRSHSMRHLISAAVWVWVAFAIRYAGVALIAVGGAWLLLGPPRGVRRRVRDAAVFGVVSVLFPIAWMLRNHSIDGTFLGIRYSSARGLIPNTFDALATFGNFLVPGIAIEQRKIWAVVALAGIAVMATLVWRVIRHDERIHSVIGVAELGATATGLIVCQIVIYTLYMLYARTTTGLNQLDFRLLNPIYIPLVLCCLVVIDRVLARGGETEPSTRLARAALSAWAALSIVLGMVMVGYFTTDADLFSGNYERQAFDTARHSKALDSIDANCDRSTQTLSSNLPNALYEAGVEADWSPRLTGLESTDPVDDLARLHADVGRRRHCLIWIDLEPTYGHLATLERLRHEFHLEQVAHDGKVSLYTVSAR